MAVGEDVVGADGLTNRQRFDMRREQKRREAEARANAAETSRKSAEARERARAEAAAGMAPAASGGGMLTSEDRDALYTESYVDDYGVTRTRRSRAYWDELNKYSGEERRYQELLMGGAIDEQGNIKPGAINPTEIMRGEAPSWATPELIKNAYILAFEAQNRSGQNFMNGRDYRNFLDAGYSLTEDQMNSLGGVQGQGNQDDLTFGGGQTTTGVANPPPQNTSNPPMSDDTFETDRDTYTSTGNEFLDGYDSAQPEAPAPTDPVQPTPQKNTPFADAYFKAMEEAKKKGPVSSMFADMLPGE